MSNVTLFQALAIKHALRFYAKHKKQINRAYTPTAMLRTATAITGKPFKRGEYLQAADAISAMLEA
jgi:hypothetical protein